MKTFNKILAIALDVIIVLLLILAIIFVVATVSASKNDGVGQIFGKSIFSVQSPSMSGTFEEGDVIIGNVFDVNNDEVHVGDIITFYETSVMGRYVNTHRVVRIEGGKIYTQGDANALEDTNTVSRDRILAIYPHVGECSQDVHAEHAKGTSSTHTNDIAILGGVGNVIDFLKEPLGFVLCILLPLGLFVAYEVFNFIKAFKEYNKEKAEVIAMEKTANAFANLSDEEKEKLIAEFESSKKQKEESSQDQE